MEKNCLIRQPAGLGDIFFCQKIADQLLSKNYKIIWPIIEPFKWLPEYIKKPGISYPLVTDNFKYKHLYRKETPPIYKHNFLYLPLESASQWAKADTFMEAKYTLVGGNSTNWKDHFILYRNKEREQKLNDYFNIEVTNGVCKQFNLVNRNFASPPDIQKNLNIKPRNNNQTIEVDFLGWDNIFDWCDLIELADEVHTVETSFCYIIEKIRTTGKLYLYPRNKQHDNYDYIKNVFTKNWNYV